MSRKYARRQRATAWWQTTRTSSWRSSSIITGSSLITRSSYDWSATHSTWPQQLFSMQLLPTTFCHFYLLWISILKFTFLPLCVNTVWNTALVNSNILQNKPAKSGAKNIHALLRMTAFVLVFFYDCTLYTTVPAFAHTVWEKGNPK